MSTQTIGTLRRTEIITAGVQAHALVSAGLHMSSRDLPAFLSIDVPGTVHTSDRVRIHVAPRHLTEWTESLRHTVTRDDVDGGEEVDGLLPDTGVRVTVYVTRILTAVPA